MSAKGKVVMAGDIEVVEMPGKDENVIYRYAILVVCDSPEDVRAACALIGDPITIEAAR